MIHHFGEGRIRSFIVTSCWRPPWVTWCCISSLTLLCLSFVLTFWKCQLPRFYRFIVVQGPPSGVRTPVITDAGRGLWPTKRPLWACTSRDHHAAERLIKRWRERGGEDNKPRPTERRRQRATAAATLSGKFTSTVGTVSLTIIQHFSCLKALTSLGVLTHEGYKCVIFVLRWWQRYVC